MNNMTPREKADELIYIFAQIIPPSSYVAFEEGVQINFDLENAKQCALIAVDEIINFGNQVGIREPMMFWNKVLEEVNKL